jgi:excisionase family DNA binding protein
MVRVGKKYIERIPMDSNTEYSAQLLTVSEIAQTLRVPVSWVYERTRRRGFEGMPHIKLGKYLRFDPDTVSEWLKSMREN